jgi:5-methylcytosine-specific restriction endonuclease McrA
MTAAAVAYQKTHPEKKRAADQRYYQKHKDESAEYKKNWRKENQEKYKANNKEYYQKKKETIKDRAKKWYVENKERIRLITAEYRKNNAEVIKERKAKYSKNNRDKRNAMEQKRRAIKKGNGGKYTHSEFIELCNKFGNKCLMCNRSDVRLTVDHVIPLSKGGLNVIENIQPLCLSCNSKKHDKIIDLRY